MPGFRGKVTDDQARELVASPARFAKGRGRRPADFAARFRQLQDELDALAAAVPANWPRAHKVQAGPVTLPPGGYGAAHAGSARPPTSRAAR